MEQSTSGVAGGVEEDDGGEVGWMERKTRRPQHRGGRSLPTDKNVTIAIRKEDQKLVKELASKSGVPMLVLLHEIITSYKEARKDEMQTSVEDNLKR